MAGYSIAATSAISCGRPVERLFVSRDDLSMKWTGRPSRSPGNPSRPNVFHLYTGERRDEIDSVRWMAQLND